MRTVGRPFRGSRACLPPHRSARQTDKKKLSELGLRLRVRQSGRTARSSHNRGWLTPWRLASARTTDDVWTSWCTAPRHSQVHVAGRHSGFPTHARRPAAVRSHGDGRVCAPHCRTPQTRHLPRTAPSWTPRPPRAGIRSRRALEWRGGTLRGTPCKYAAPRRGVVQALVGYAGNRGPASGRKHSARQRVAGASANRLTEPPLESVLDLASVAPTTRGVCGRCSQGRLTRH